MPVGVIALPALVVSVTVAVHVVGCSTATRSGEQLTSVWLVRRLTLTAWLPLLGLCAPCPWPGKSPPYEAVIVCDPVPTAVGL